MTDPTTPMFKVVGCQPLPVNPGTCTRGTDGELYAHDGIRAYTAGEVGRVLGGWPPDALTRMWELFYGVPGDDGTAHMRFRAGGGTPSPVAPRDRAEGGAELLTLAQAADRSGWPASHVARLWETLYGTAAERRAEGEQGPWREAIADDAVWERLAVVARTAGQVPPAAVLVAALDVWAEQTADRKGRAILAAQDFNAGVGSPVAGGTATVRGGDAGRQ